MPERRNSSRRLLRTTLIDPTPDEPIPQLETLEDRPGFITNLLLTPEQTRLIARNGGSHPNILIQGDLRKWGYIYHELIDMAWLKLFGYMFIIYAIYNTFVALLFWAVNGVKDTSGEFDDINFIVCLYFVVQTMDTIGCGKYEYFIAFFFLFCVPCHKPCFMFCVACVFVLCGGLLACWLVCTHERRQ